VGSAARSGVAGAGRAEVRAMEVGAAMATGGV
jgi:hypothetical protein